MIEDTRSKNGILYERLLLLKVKSPFLYCLAELLRFAHFPSGRGDEKSRLISVVTYNFGKRILAKLQ